jgi:hypothetical protein
MYRGFNIKRERKRTKVEELQDEIKRLHKLLGAMMHLHERLKNERIENPEAERLPILPQEHAADGKPIERTPETLLEGANSEPTAGKDQKGA